MLRISMLGTSAHTKRVEPTFPLLFHECFHFRKVCLDFNHFKNFDLGLVTFILFVESTVGSLHFFIYFVTYTETFIVGRLITVSTLKKYPVGPSQ